MTGVQTCALPIYSFRRCYAQCLEVGNKRFAVIYPYKNTLINENGKRIIYLQPNGTIKQCQNDTVPGIIFEQNNINTKGQQQQQQQQQMIKMPIQCFQYKYIYDLYKAYRSEQIFLFDDINPTEFSAIEIINKLITLGIFTY